MDCAGADTPDAVPAFRRIRREFFDVVPVSMSLELPVVRVPPPETCVLLSCWGAIRALELQHDMRSRHTINKIAVLG